MSKQQQHESERRPVTLGDVIGLASIGARCYEDPEAAGGRSLSAT
jgi:hypothetical protein